jgi:hypothetical protein
MSPVLRVENAKPVSEGSDDGCCVQGRTTPIQLNQLLSQKWDNKSSHMIIMLSGASVPPPSKTKVY